MARFTKDPTLFGRVYGLYDPREGALRYVGQTVRTLEVRLKAHLTLKNLARSHHSAHWLASLRRSGLRPIIRELGTAFSREELDRLEVKEIATARSAGANLTNHTNGGLGQSGRRCSGETREKMSLAKKGRPGSRKGTQQSHEAREKISASLRGKFGERSRPFRCNISTAVILQRVSEGATRKQIAQELGTAVGTISKRLVAARRDGLAITRPKKKCPRAAEKLRGRTGRTARAYRHDVPMETVLSLMRTGLSQRAIAKRLCVCRHLVHARILEAKQAGVF
jgi:transposase